MCVTAEVKKYLAFVKETRFGYYIPNSAINRNFLNKKVSENEEKPFRDPL